MASYLFLLLLSPLMLHLAGCKAAMSPGDTSDLPPGPVVDSNKRAITTYTGGPRVLHDGSADYRAEGRGRPDDETHGFTTVATRYILPEDRTLRVGPDERFPDLHTALDYLADKRIRTDEMVDIVIAAGFHEYYQPVVVRHIDGARIRVRGEDATPIQILSEVKRGAPANLCGENAVVLRIAASDRGKVAMGDYVLIQDTHGRRDRHLLHRGVWEVCYVWKNTNWISVINHNALHRHPGHEETSFTEASALVVKSILRFYCSVGILVEGTQLGLMEHVVLVGDYSGWNGASRGGAATPAYNRTELDHGGNKVVLPQHLADHGYFDEVPACTRGGKWTEGHTGIWARNHGRLHIRNVGITSFDGQGVLTSQGGVITAHSTAAVHNERRGFYAMNRSRIEAEGCIGSANNTDGFIADHGGVVVLHRATAARNRENGYLTMFGGTLEIEDGGMASDNGSHGFLAKAGVMIVKGTSSAPSLSSFNSIAAGASYGGTIRARHLSTRGSLVGSLRVPNHGRYYLGEGVSYAPDAPATLDGARVPPAPEDPSFWLAPRGDLMLRSAEPPAFEQTLQPHHADREVILGVGDGMDYARLHEALDALRPLYIPTNVTVRLVLSSGTHEYDRAVVIDHPCANQLQIVGEDRRPNHNSTEVEELVWVRRLRGVETHSPGLHRIALETSSTSSVTPGDYLILRESVSGAQTHFSASGEAMAVNHWAHQGVWRVNSVGDGLLQVTNSHRDGFPAFDLDDRMAFACNWPAVRRIAGDLSAVDSQGEPVQRRRDGRITPDEGELDRYEQGRLIKAVVKKTVLNLRCSSGLVVRGTSLNMVSNLAIVGDHQAHLASPPTYADLPACAYTTGTGWTGSFHGVHATDQGYIHVAPNTAISGFDGSGLAATQGSAIDAHGASSTNHHTAGYYAAAGSTVEAKFSVGSGNRTDGYRAEDGSTIYAAGSTASGNGGSGFRAERDSNISATMAVATRNRLHGFSSQHGSVVDVYGRGYAARPNVALVTCGHEHVGPFLNYGIAAWNGRSGYFALDGVLMVDRTTAQHNEQHGYSLAGCSAARAPGAVAISNGLSDVEIYDDGIFCSEEACHRQRGGSGQPMHCSSDDGAGEM